MHRSCGVALLALALPLLGLAGCNGRESAAAALPTQANASAITIVGGATLQATTMDVADLNETVARRYAIERGSSGLMLLVTVRDASGNGIEPGDLRLDAVAGALLDASKPLALRPITTGGMTDYIGVFHASPPATVQFRIGAVRNGARAEISTTADLYQR
ncbi:DUF4426 domain-containing protein [Thermomonas sp.]|uniref:DUF4426 domain-containing protein n=1 Tax=Thermomonas sp. TaxID=1971895 RepID=UPI00248829CF|nr:DUF4426 domain-containing protein [Thermomonas sp.]MDI1251877.1 DUF4426 domain-containing protein [Thermomonas sp.]